MNDKILKSVLSGDQDTNIRFNDLQTLLNQLEFNYRQSGKGSSHYIYYRDDIPELINIQRDGNKAKPYQVKQIRTIIKKYGLGGQLHV